MSEDNGSGAVAGHNNEHLVILPCPCCKSTNYSPNMWSLDAGEVDAIECNDCLCGAPLDAWQNRK